MAEPERVAARAPFEDLPRRLGLWSAIAVVVGSTIGSGIFRSPAAIADRLPGPLPMLAIWVAAGAFVLCGALTLAELSGAYPRSGGVYVYLREGWGKLPAFLFGWAELAVIRAAALGAISTTFAEYALRLTGADTRVEPYSSFVHYIAAAAIIVVAVFNYLGIRWGALVQNVTTAGKYGGLVVLVVLALVLGFTSTGGHFSPAAPPGSFAVAPFGLALVSVLWAYDGWADVTFVSGEVRDPRRNLPLAMIVGVFAIIAIYLLANVAYLAVLPIEEIRRSPLVAADVAERVMGAGGVVFVALTVVVSTFGTLNGSMMTGSRVLFAFGEQRRFFGGLRKVHPRFATPHVAIVVAALLGAAFVLVGTFERLADAFITAIVPFYALSVAAVYRVRRRPEYNPPFRVPGYPVVPAIFIAATLYLLVNALIDPSSRWPTAGVLAAVLAGIPVYWLTTPRSER
jgi:APA family basic amino acid/polyamine antiporter